MKQRTRWWLVVVSLVCLAVAIYELVAAAGAGLATPLTSHGDHGAHADHVALVFGGLAVVGFITAVFAPSPSRIPRARARFKP